MILRPDGETGILKIGSPPEVLPGIIESVRINGSLLMENAETQGRSGKVKIVQGWDDAALLITISLIDNPDEGKTRWDCLKQIAGVFKKVADNGKPEVYTLSHPMIGAWGTRQLLFSSLESSETRTRRKISVSLEFVEYDSSAAVVQERKETAKQAKQPNPEDVAKARERMLVSDRQRQNMGKLENRFGKI